MASYHVAKIARNFYVLRVNDGRVKYFEGIWEIPEGITYNAYLLTLPDKTILFDGWKKDYSDEFIEAIKSTVDINDIDIIVLHHIEPDHTGSIPVLLSKMNRQAKIYAHPLARSMLSSFYSLNLKTMFLPAKDGEILDLGDEKITFIHTPWLHWPETIISYLKKYNTLITCDVFGGYSIPRGFFDDELDERSIQEYLYYARKYMVTVIGNYRNHIIPALNKIASLGIKPSVIAPGHGLIWRKHPEKIIKAYKDFAENKYDDKKITMIYTSMYGFTDRVMNQINKYLIENKYFVTIHKFTDKDKPFISEILVDADTSKALIIGISNYEASVHPHMEHVLDILVKKIKAPKPVLVVTIYGWGDAAKTLAKKKLERTPLNPVGYISLRAGMSMEYEQVKNFLETIRNNK